MVVERRLFLKPMIKTILFSLGCIWLLPSCSSLVRLSVNPDRSGKMEVKLNAPSFTNLANRFGNGSTTKRDTELQMARFLKVLAEAMRGVDELCDVEFEDDGDACQLRLTAYFKDFNKLRLIGDSPGRPGGTSNDETSSRIGENGYWILTLATRHDAANETTQLTSQVPIDEVQLNLEVLEYQIQMKAAAIVLGKVVAELPKEAGERVEVTVGGTIVKAEGLQQDGPNKAWRFDSVADTWKAMEKLITDPHVWRNLLVASKQQGTSIASYDARKLPQEFQQYLTNVLREIRPDYQTDTRLTIQPGAPVFDYQSEVAAAKKRPGRLLVLMRNLGDELPKPPENELKNRPILGVQYGPGPSGGAKVSEVIKGSPAEEGGVRAGDVIQRVDGADLDDEKVFQQFIKSLLPNEKVTLGILRDGKTFEVELTPRIVEGVADQ